LDQSLQSILAVRFTLAFLPGLALRLATRADLRACIVRGPPFGERSSVSRVCLQGGGERRGGCAGSLVRWPRAKSYFRVSFCFQGLWRGRPWRPSLRRRVRGTPVIAEPSLGHGERGRSALAATHSRFIFFPFLLLPFLNPSSRHPSPTPILRRICGLSPTAREGGRRRATPSWRPAAEQRPSGPDHKHTTSSAPILSTWWKPLIYTAVGPRLRGRAEPVEQCGAETSTASRRP
jgi:hypothetical protein